MDDDMGTPFELILPNKIIDFKLPFTSGLIDNG